MKQSQEPVAWHLQALMTVIGLSFLLRIWGIWNATSTDEYNEVFEALRVCSGNLNFERWFKRFYCYILSIEFGVYYVIGWALDVFHSPSDFALKILRDTEPLFLLGRTTSALLGTGSVFMTYLVGKNLLNKSTGLLAALFLCLNVENIELSHYARVDASLCFMVMVTFYFITQIFSFSSSGKQDGLLTPHTRWYLLSGIFLGCAFQNKPQAIVLTVPFAYAHLRNYPIRSWAKGLLDKKVIYFCMALILGLVIGNPALLFAPEKFVTSLLGLGKVYTTAINESVSDTIGFIAYLHYFYKELGFILSFVAGYSLIKAFLSRRSEHILLLCFLVPFYIIMGASRYMVSYSYMIPLMPFLYLLMADCLLQIKSVRISGAKSSLTFAFIVIFALVQPLYNVAQFELSISGPNTRLLAKKWIEENIPFDSKMLMDSGKTINSFAPLIAMNEISIDRLLASKKKAIKDGSIQDNTKTVDEKSLVYFEMLRKTVPAESYDIISTGFGLDVQSLDYYLNNDFKYLVISESMKQARTEYSFAARQPDIAAFYLSLKNDPRIKLGKTIKSTAINRGDTFYVYELMNNVQRDRIN